MDGLIELIFDAVPDGSVDGLVYGLLQEASPMELSHSELGLLDPKQLDQGLKELLKDGSVSASIFIRAASVRVGDVRISAPLIRILRSEGSSEVAVIFGSADIDPTDRQEASKKLLVGADLLARGADVADYFCGYEPATDESTRLFSRDRIGPLVRL